MLEAQHPILGRIVVNRIHIPQARRRHAQVVRPKLPHLVHRHPARKHRVLPRLVVRRVVPGEGGPVLLQNHGLAHRRTHLVVLADPLVAPRVVVPPRVRVQVERAVVERRDAQVGHEIDARGPVVRRGPVVAVDVRCVRAREPAFVAQRDEVGRVEALDVRRGGARPLGHHRRAAPRAARLVGELPGEDGRRVLVPGDEHVDVVAVDALAGRVGEPLGGVGAEGGCVGCDAAV